MRAFWLTLLLVVCAATEAEGRVKVKQGHKEAGVPIFKGHTSERERTEVARWLTQLGYSQYATPEFLDKLDDELAIETIEDLVTIAEEDDYKSLGISAEDAQKIGSAATREVMTRFLETVPGSDGKTGGYLQYLDKFIEQGYTEVDDVADLDEEDAPQLGMSIEDMKVLVDKAEIWEARATFIDIMLGAKVGDEPNPFGDRNAVKAYTEDLIKIGARSLHDLARLDPKKVDVMPAALLHTLMNQPAVLGTLNKQEL